MEALYIKATKINPEITLDKDKNIFKISGRSLIENPGKFYMPVYQWVEEYSKDPNEETTFEFDLEYFNSSSARQVMKLIILLENLSEEGKNINLVWAYEAGDEMTKERGEEIAAVSTLNIKIKEYPSEDFKL